MREQIDYLKAALQNKRSELARAIRSQSTQLIVCEGEHDVLDLVQSIYRREETVTFLNTLTRTLADVDAALMAMNEGSYGTCLDCGEPIASRRLQAMPWASHCIRCQQAHDHSKQLRVVAMGWSEAA
jgi:DnaK suppressor protein